MHNNHHHHEAVGHFGLRRLTADATLADVLQLLRTAREASLQMDEQLRVEGMQPHDAAIGIPVDQVDAMLLALERETALLQTTLDLFESERAAYAKTARLMKWLGYAVMTIGLFDVLDMLRRAWS